MKRNRAVALCYIFGYSFINLPFASFLLWGPALFERSHGLGPAEISIPLALIFLIPTLLGQWLGASATDRMVAKGRRDAPFVTAAFAAAAMIPAAIAMPVLGDATLAFAALGFLVFLTCASVGHHAVVAAMVAPNRLRGLLIATFFFVQNILAQAIVALIIALLTDELFGAPEELGKSMAIVGGAGATVGFVLLMTGRAKLRRAVAENPEMNPQAAPAPETEDPVPPAEPSAIR